MTNKVFDNSLFKDIRKEFRLSQAQFAEELGTSQQAIAMIENNRRGVPKSIIQALKAKYGIIYDENLRDTYYFDHDLIPKNKSGIEPKKYKVSISLDICSPDETSAMTCVLNAMSKTGKCLVNKIEIL